MMWFKLAAGEGGQPWMTRPYSRDLRQRVVDAVEAGASRRATAGRFEVSVSFVIKLVQRFRRTGSLEPERYGGWKRSTVLAHAHLVRALLLAEPDLTLEERRHRLAGQGARVSTAALNRFLALDGLTRKKDPARGRAGTTGRRRSPRRLAQAAAGDEPGTPRLHRRNVGHHSYGQAAWPGPARATRGQRHSARPLEDHDISRGAAP